MSTIYFNNAATTFPKPRSVREAVSGSFDRPMVDADRGGAAGAGDLDLLRRALASLLGVGDSDRVALTPSATYAINTVVLGLLGGETDAHVVATALEHNSVLRPLAHLEARGAIRVSIIPPDSTGAVSSADVGAALRPDTKLVCAAHVANANGAVNPIEEISAAAARAGVPLLVDAAQSAGVVPLRHAGLEGRVFVAVAGHKALYGPTGIGALLLPDAELPQSFVGGTGVRSEARQHPTELPLRHEAGTANHVGAVGLLAGLAYVEARSLEALGARRSDLVMAARRGLSSISRVRLARAPERDARAGIVAFSCDGIPTSEVGFALRESFGIACRDGLHCAPNAHRALGTWPEGTVRFSFGDFNTQDEIARSVDAVRALCAA
jgi:cysteine desulfurase / selenocysteine lyase